MTRKHFEAIAESLADLKDTACDGKTDGELVWWAACEAMAETCKRFNHNFSENKFMTACGYIKG